jgi:hypothetical protein
MADESGAAPGRTQVGAAAVVERLWGVGHDLTLVGRLTGGETGAFEVGGRGGERLVLKWSTDPEVFVERAEAAALTERLRTEAGWPVPRLEVIELPGLQVTLQELLPGEMVTVLRQPLADQLLALHERRRGLAWREDRRHFGDELVTTLTVGGRGYCRHDMLRTFDDRTRRLDDRIVEIGASAEPDDFPTDDIVHWDLHNENVLALDGRVTAVVDSEYALVGDAGFDLVTLALCTLGADPGPGSVGAHLWGRVADEVDARLAPAYVAHILLRAVDWEIRNHEAAELDLWLAEAERRLPPG